MKSLLFIILIFSLIFGSIYYLQLDNKSDTDISDTKKTCFYYNEVSDLGKGILIWDYNCESDISFYRERNLKTIDIQQNYCEPPIFCPLFYKPDYGIMHIVVLEEGEKFYEVLINGNQIRYVSKNNKFIEFVTWEEYLINRTTGLTISNNKKVFKILSVKRDSLNIVDSLSADYLKKNVRWRDGNKIIVKLLLLN